VIFVHHLSLKIPDELQQRLADLAHETRINQSELVRRALAQFLDQQGGGGRSPSPGDLAADLAGSLQGGPADLASNPDHLADFGR